MKLRTKMARATTAIRTRPGPRLSDSSMTGGCRGPRIAQRTPNRIKWYPPKSIPAEARDKLVAAIRKIATGKEYNEFMTQRGFGVVYAGPDDYAKFMAKSDTDLGATMKTVGIVK